MHFDSDIIFLELQVYVQLQHVSGVYVLLQVERLKGWGGVGVHSLKVVKGMTFTQEFDVQVSSNNLK